MSVPIHISRGSQQEEEEAEHANDKQDKPQPQCFVDMQKSMEVELERRRKDWEKDVEVMQQDFFQPQGGKAVEGESGSNNNTTSSRDNNVQMYHTSNPKRTPGGTEVFDINKSLYDDDTPGPEAGHYKFKLRFDVHGFEPRDIGIRSQGDKITVSAKHEDASATGGKSTRQFNRQVDVPDNVNPDRLTSYLSPDGVLTVEAPYESTPRPKVKTHTESKIIGGRADSLLTGHPAFPDLTLEEPRVVHHTTRSTRYGSPSNIRTTHYRVGTGSPLFHQEELAPPEYRNVVKTSKASSTTPIIYSGSPKLGHTPGFLQSTAPKLGPFDYNNARIEDTPDGRKLRLVIDLGGSYKPEEIDMRLVGQKIKLQAKHEEKIGGRTSRCEFSREFELPEAVEVRTLRAMMAPDGRITVGASIKGNQNHDQVLEAVLVDMPSGGRPCAFKRD